MSNKNDIICDDMEQPLSQIYNLDLEYHLWVSSVLKLTGIDYLLKNQIVQRMKGNVVKMDDSTGSSNL